HEETVSARSSSGPALRVDVSDANACHVTHLCLPFLRFDADRYAGDHGIDFIRLTGDHLVGPAGTVTEAAGDLVVRHDARPNLVRHDYNGSLGATSRFRGAHPGDQGAGLDRSRPLVEAVIRDEEIGHPYRHAVQDDRLRAFERAGQRIRYADGLFAQLPPCRPVALVRGDAPRHLLVERL